MRPQLFMVSQEIMAALTLEELVATIKSMIEMNLLQAPFLNFDVCLPKDALNGVMAKYGFEGIDKRDVTCYIKYRLRDLNIDRTAGVRIDLSPVDRPDLSFIEFIERTNPDPEDRKQVLTQFRSLGLRVLSTLVVLLATKNVVKTVKVDKLAKLGIGKHRHSTTTTLTIGKITERSDGSAETGHGIEKRPHLRRGHPRDQRHGPGLQFVKRIFIQPMFVNVDKEWLAERTAYNVRLETPTKEEDPQDAPA